MYKLGLNCELWSESRHEYYLSNNIDLGQHVHYGYPGDNITLYFGLSCNKVFDYEDIKVPNFNMPN